MNLTARTVVSVFVALSILCVFDFATRVRIQPDIKHHQQSGQPIPSVLKTAETPEDLVALLARYQSGTARQPEGGSSLAGESGSLADFQFSLLAIYQTSGQYTAVLSVKGLKEPSAETIKMNKTTVYSDVVVQQIEQKFIVLAHQQQTIRLRLFEKSGSKS